MLLSLEEFFTRFDEATKKFPPTTTFPDNHPKSMKTFQELTDKLQVLEKESLKNGRIGKLLVFIFISFKYIYYSFHFFRSLPTMQGVGASSMESALLLHTKRGEFDGHRTAIDQLVGDHEGATQIGLQEKVQKLVSFLHDFAHGAKARRG